MQQFSYVRACQSLSARGEIWWNGAKCNSILATGHARWPIWYRGKLGIIINTIYNIKSFSAVSPYNLMSSQDTSIWVANETEELQ